MNIEEEIDSMNDGHPVFIKKIPIETSVAEESVGQGQNVDDKSSYHKHHFVLVNEESKREEHIELKKNIEPPAENIYFDVPLIHEEVSPVKTIDLSPDSDTRVGNKKSEIEIPNYQKNTQAEEIKDIPVQKKFHVKLYLLIMALIVFIALASGAAFYFYKKSKAVSVDVSQSGQKQLENTLTLVKKIAILPKDNEAVTLLSVYDLAQVKTDPFFIDAEIGDKLLLYTNIGRAVLYRPSTNQIVNMMSFPLNANEVQNLPSTTKATSTKVQ